MANLREIQHPSNPPPEEEDNDTTKIQLTQLLPELILETLCRAPVKSLMIFRATSKFSCAVIDNPVFIEFHLRFNRSRNTAVISHNTFDEDGRRTVLLLRVNAPPLHVLEIDKHYEVRRDLSPVNFFQFSKNMVLAGSINGIVCVAHKKEFSERFVGLWNPALNCWKSIELPITKSWKNMSVGLGFDAETNDYKIICIIPVARSSTWSRIQMYSCNQERWAEINIEEIVYFEPQETLQCKFIVNGVPYWIGYSRLLGDCQIFARISPCTGLFQRFRYPQGVNDSLVHLVNLRESVAALVRCPAKYSRHFVIDLYLMEENSGNWTRLYSIGLFEGDGLSIPQCMSTGEIVIYKWMHFQDAVTCFYDPQTGRVSLNDEIDAYYPSWYTSYNHVESLVRLTGMVQIGMEHSARKKNLLSKDWTQLLSKDFESALHL